MDIGLILTYRCNSRCSMCNIWKYPSLPAEEVSLNTLAKLPGGLDYLNLTGGEPTLRADLLDMVDLLYPKATKFEISTNGLLPRRIEAIIKKYPDVKIRFSLEGFEKTNDLIRGERNGFRTKVDGLLRLKELGGEDLGFAITIQDDNADELAGLFEFCEEHGFDLATSTLHNGFQFHKNDNRAHEPVRLVRAIEALATEQLKTRKIKNWFRAYLNLGLAARALGQPRLLPCPAGTEFAFVDPWGDVFACNVRPDLKMGNLNDQTWDEILESRETAAVRQNVSLCRQNCWMVGSAKTAMRHPRFAFLPRWSPLFWVAKNKLRLSMGGKIAFGQCSAESGSLNNEGAEKRRFHTGHTEKRKIQTREAPEYAQKGPYENK